MFSEETREADGFFLYERIDGEDDFTYGCRIPPYLHVNSPNFIWSRTVLKCSSFQLPVIVDEKLSVTFLEVFRSKSRCT